MKKSSNPDRRTTQRTAALKPVNYLPQGSRKRAASVADPITTKKQKKEKSGGSKLAASHNHEGIIRRHPAPDILSDSGNESPKDIPSPAPVITQRRQTATTDPDKTSSKGKVTHEQNLRDEHTDVDNSNQESNEEENEDEVKDLQTHNHDALKSVFASERPQWKDRIQNKTQKHQARESDCDDEVLSGTNRDFSPKRAQLNAHGEDSADGDDSEGEVPSRKSKASIQPKKLSKREIDRRNEVPQWTSNKRTSVKPATQYRQISKVIVLSDSDSNSAGNESGAGHDVSRLQINKGWPAEAFFVQPKQGSRIISLKDQPAPLNKTLSRAIRESLGDVLFDSAFPSIDENYKYHRKLLRSCARELKFDQLAERFSRDVDFGMAMARLIQQRISNLRGVFKSKGRSRVEATFLLIANDPNTIVKVENLTQRTEYIFKPNNNGMGYDKLAPFRHPSIIAILQDVVFKGSRGSALSEKYSAKFLTIPATELHPKRRMLSEAMVCMAATAVHAVTNPE